MTEKRDTSPTGQRRRKNWRQGVPTRRFLICLFVVTAVYVTAGWWKSEYDSCHRADSNRAFMREILDRTGPATADLPRPPRLSCWRLLPDNGNYPTPR